MSEGIDYDSLTTHIEQLTELERRRYRRWWWYLLLLFLTIVSAAMIGVGLLFWAAKTTFGDEISVRAGHEKDVQGQ